MRQKSQASARALDALGNPARREILRLLSADERSVGDLAAKLPVSRPAVSRHLRLLTEAGLVTHRQEGTLNLYRLDAHGFDEARSWLDSFWDDALSRFKMVADNSTHKGKRR